MRGLVVTLLLFALPALAQVQPQPPTPLSPDSTSIREIAAIIAERDRQYAQRFEAQQKAVDAALASAEKAVAAALVAQDKATAAAFAAQGKATDAAFAAANEAVKTAQQANDKRLDSVNEFRGQLKDQAGTLATRTEVTVQFKATADKLDELTKALTEIRARAEGAATLWTAAMAVVGILIGALTVSLLVYRRLRHNELS